MSKTSTLRFTLSFKKPNFNNLPNFIPRHKSSLSQSSVSSTSSTKLDTSLAPQSITAFPVRVHKDEDQVSQSALDARNNFQGLLPDADYRSHSSGPYGNFFALTWPDGITERVKLGTEIIETLWLYDDVIEDVPHNGALEVHAGVRDSLAGKPDKPSSKIQVSTLFNRFGERLIKMDRKGAPRVIDSLKSYLDNYDSRKTPFATIGEYTEYRRVNVGFGIMESFMQWTLGISLNEAEIELSRDFYLSSGRVLGLTNDYFSWNVERKEPADRQWNAVPLIMKQYNLNEKDATVFLRGLVVYHEQQVRKLGVELLKRSKNSPKMVKYVNAMGLLLGGNCFWSSNCERYNPEM
ncbi:terpenoid synthase [Hypoxylon trugodes]|uniref:terpenoid synthase n=1 Tax=Hypoxylon trugodes TaxID=326681 RepID=UPI0021919A28|nr:terpenoid synthase [Hypoxylon trugodes]KAI1390398.1 terpenoid synthase [Hypoxylon trugodes]